MSKPMTPPDILWIVTTQWRAQACGYAGDRNARTPALDELARQSVSYTEAVTPHPFGPFARAALFTGVPSPENGVRDYFDALPAYDASASDAGRPQGGLDAPARSTRARGRTVAHELWERGYATAFFGKWHLARREPTAPLVGEVHARTIVPPEARGGFHYWEGFESGFLLNDPWLHGTRLPVPVKFPGYQSDVVGRRAAEWVEHGGAPEGDARKPWFVVVSLEPPHPPYDAPSAGVPPRDPRELILPANIPRGGDVESQARRELSGYYAHIEATDRAIGRLVAAVDAAAVRRQRSAPIFVVTSVHGDMHGAHGHFRKGWPHEESVRVPLLVRDPSRRHAPESERRSAELVTLLDVPHWTIAWAAGERAAAREPAGQTARQAQRISMPTAVPFPRQCDRVWRGMRTSRWKLVLHDDGTPWLFFDLANDPAETRNLVGDPGHAGRLAAWRDWVLERASAPTDRLE